MFDVFLISIDSALLVLSSITTRQLLRSYRLFAPTRAQGQAQSQSQKPLYTAGSAPTVSVCIPARNEQHVMTDCLTRVLQSTYPKLEIIVLDDSSTDNTSALIKSFASEGVRFVEGEPLPAGWLGKNHALQGLLEAASGDYILFLDVDTMLAPHTIDTLITQAIANDAAMISALPRRDDGWRASVFFSPLRYYWELVFYRRLAPASSSSAWLIERNELLRRFDGFKAFKATFRPEAHIAAELSERGRYRFYISDETFGVAYEKKWRSQLLTSVRLLFPFVGGKRFMAFIALLGLLVLLAPFIAALATVITAIVAPSATASLMMLSPGCAALGIMLLFGLFFSVLYASYARHVWQKGWYLGFVLWPIVLVQEIVLLITSVIAHTTHRVTWKGRPLMLVKTRSSDSPGLTGSTDSSAEQQAK